MHKFVRNFITEWRRLGLPVERGTVVAAVSGGADSLSLLLALIELTNKKKLAHRIVVAHLNHGIRGQEADEDETFVRDIAAAHKLDFVSETARLSKRGNLEQNARNRRYEFLESVADREKAFAVLTGHTMDDQAETILMNLIRGCGPDGLSGMQAHRGRIVRPLLRWCRRRQTEEFCRAKNVDFRQDRMNDDASFRRVQIRREIIPLLAGMNPRIVETLCASAELIRPAAPVAPANDMLSIAELKALRQVERLTAIRCWLEHHRGNTRQLGLKHIQAVERLALSEKSGRAVELPGKATVNRSSGRLSYKKDKVDKSAHDN